MAFLLYDVHDELDIAVDESDGPVPKELVKRLTQLVQEADVPLEESCQVRGGVDIFEGSFEDMEEDGDQDIVVVPVECVRQAIVAWS